MSEHNNFCRLEMHMALYGMFLLVSGQQPDQRLHWWEQGLAEDGASELENWLE